MNESKFNIDTELEVVFNSVIHRMMQPTPEIVFEVEKQNIEKLTIKNGSELKTESNPNKKYILFYNRCVKSAKFADKEKGNAELKGKVPDFEKILIGKELTKITLLDRQDVEDQYGPEAMPNIDYGQYIVYAHAWQAGKPILVKHLFATPGDKDLSEYDRINSLQTIKQKKSKTVVTPGNPARLWINLYDNCIQKVEGYTLGEKDMSPKDVPPLHKIKVIMELFSYINEDLSEIEGN